MLLSWFLCFSLSRPLPLATQALTNQILPCQYHIISLHAAITQNSDIKGKKEWRREMTTSINNPLLSVDHLWRFWSWFFGGMEKIPPQTSKPWLPPPPPPPHTPTCSWRPPLSAMLFWCMLEAWHVSCNSKASFDWLAGRRWRPRAAGVV